MFFNMKNKQTISWRQQEIILVKYNRQINSDLYELCQQKITKPIIKYYLVFNFFDS